LTAFRSAHVPASEVHDVLGQHQLVEAFKLVLDIPGSRSPWLADAVSGERYLDCYTFFASAPLGINPPGVVDDPQFMATLAEVAANKPANPDVYTVHLAEFAETFARVLGDPALPHLFFVEGGALAVENALKTAFDWKSRRNEAAGRSPELGTQVMHLTRAFHGRSGYTLSLTNTDPVKTDRYPKFGWPRLDVPAVEFPLERNLAAVEAAERRALDQARAAFEANPHDIACFIAEPIQSEGGDNHMRPEFLQAMQRLCHEHDALFVLDEVQTGVGLTGTAWAYQQLGLQPDIVAFAKKVQVGGIMAGRRATEGHGGVFEVPSRIGSTWGGGLVDMVRSRRYLEIIEADGLFDHAAQVGKWFLAQLTEVADRYPGLMLNTRGRGLMCAFDLPDGATRNGVIEALRGEHVLVLPCGPRSVRFRPPLSITEDDLSIAIAALGRVLGRLAGAAGQAVQPGRASQSSQASQPRG